MIDNIVNAVLSIVGAVIRPFVTIILLALSALEVLIGQSDTIDSMRSAANDLLDWTDNAGADLLRTGVTYAIQEAANAADFPIDPEDPLSAESLTGAINYKLDTNFEDVTDSESVKEYFVLRATQELNEALGVNIFATAEDLKDPEVWARLVTALVNDGLEKTGFMADHVCEPVNMVLDRLCKVKECNECMDDYDDCLSRREAQKRLREETKKDCKRVSL